MFAVHSKEHRAKTVHIRRRAIPGFGALIASVALQAQAEATQPETPIEEIVVEGQRSYYADGAFSATRLAIPVTETPQAVFVVNADLIADQQAFRFDQILQNDASIQKSNNFLGAYSSYSLRGFQLANGSNYFRDGRTFLNLASVPVEVLDRVEVLKGPSSVLYGTLSPGGIVNMISKRPAGERETSIKATAGSFDFNHAAFDHSGLLADDRSLRYRVNGVFEKSDSFRRFANGHAFETERRIGAFALEWEPGEHTSVRLNYDYTDDGRPQDIGLANLTGDFSRYDYKLIYNQPWSRYDSRVVNYFLELNHEFSEALRIRAGASLQDYERDRYDNQTRGLPAADGDIRLRARHRINRWDYSTYFADLIAEFATGPVAHQLLIGMDKTEVKTNNNETARNVVFATNIFNPVIIPDPLIGTAAVPNTGSEDRFGITVQNMLAFGARWRLLVGGRYDRYRSAFFLAGSNASLPSPDIDNVTPRLGLVYLRKPNLSFYASYSESFEPNRPVGSGFENAGQQLDPAVGRQYEAGVKWEALEGQLLATAAAFAIERSGAPFEDAATNTIIQRGTQVHEGFEASVTGLVNDKLTLTASATFLDARFTVDDNPGIVGNTPSGVADISAALTGEYEFLQGPLGGLALQGSVFYQSERPVDDANSYRLDGYSRIDIGLKYSRQTEGGTLIVYRLRALNLLDKAYYKARSPLSVNPEQPQVIRASVELRF